MKPLFSQFDYSPAARSCQIDVASDFVLLSEPVQLYRSLGGVPLDCRPLERWRSWSRGDFRRNKSSMITLNEIAALVGGQIEGSSSIVCDGASPPQTASESEITMLDDPQRIAILEGSKACAVIAPEALPVQLAQIVVDDPHQAFAKIASHFRPVVTPDPQCIGIHSTAQIASTAKIDSSATIGPNVKIGQRTIVMPGVVIMENTQIGDDCVLMPNVTIYEHTRIADRVTIHACSVIGAHGFGYKQVDGKHVRSVQLGYVDIESDVDLGACVTVDRGTYGATRIGEGTKVDNQVMIAHNCNIGRHNLICSQVGIAGSCETGDYVILAGQVGLKDHIRLGDHSIVGAKAGVMNDFDGNEVYLGSPATTQREQMQIFAVTRKLPEMRRELKQLRNELKKLQQQQASEEQDDRKAA